MINILISRHDLDSMCNTIFETPVKVEAKSISFGYTDVPFEIEAIVPEDRDGRDFNIYLRTTSGLLEHEEFTYIKNSDTYAMLANKLTLEDCSAIHTQYSALIYFLYKNGLQDYFTDTEAESLVITEKDGVYTAEVMRGTERPDLVGCGPEGEKVMVRPAGE